ncbi:hypothetical protein JCM8547_005834 [Rhodosporidiobolus lusitaniae]
MATPAFPSSEPALSSPSSSLTTTLTSACGNEEKLEACTAAEKEAIEEYPEGGLQAWLVVFACFLFSGSLLSYGMSWGGVLVELREHFPDEGLAMLNLISGVNNAFTNGIGFFSGRLADRHGHKRVVTVGVVLCVLSMVGAAFCENRLDLLFVFQGGFLGLGIGLCFPSIMSLPSHYFLRRRAAATGLAVSGTGFGGALVSLMTRALFPRYGYRTTLLIWAALIAFCCSLGLLCIRPRPRASTLAAPATEPRQKKPWLPAGVWTDGVFYSVSLSVFVAIFGYLVPTSLLNEYTIEKVPSTGEGLGSAVPLIVSNIASGCGRIASGFIADRVGPVNMLVCSFFVGGILEIAFWPRAESLGSIIAFGALYGFTASWMVSLLPASLAQLFGSSSSSDPSSPATSSSTQNLATLSGFMLLCNAPGMAAGPTIAGLVHSAAGGSSSTAWQAVAYYGGGAMLAGAVILLYARFSRQPKVLARY